MEDYFRKIRYTTNGFDTLWHNAEQLYGSRGAFGHNLIRYFTSKEFIESCNQPKNVE